MHFRTIPTKYETCTPYAQAWYAEKSCILGEGNGYFWGLPQHLSLGHFNSGLRIRKLLHNSKLSISNKLLAYKVIFKPIWTYGKQLWGSASISNIEILERFQGKVLRVITDAPWYVPNMVLRQDLQITSVKEEIHRLSTQYRVRLYTHPNNLIVHLTVPPDHRRLRRHLAIDLPTRFNV
jgi:hypothetical protein